MESIEQISARNKSKAQNTFGPPRREDYPPNDFGDLEYEHAQDRYIMERGKAYAASMQADRAKSQQHTR